MEPQYITIGISGAPGLAYSKVSKAIATSFLLEKDCKFGHIGYLSQDMFRLPCEYEKGENNFDPNMEVARPPLKKFSKPAREICDVFVSNRETLFSYNMPEFHRELDFMHQFLSPDQKKCKGVKQNLLLLDGPRLFEDSDMVNMDLGIFIDMPEEIIRKTRTIEKFEGEKYMDICVIPMYEIYKKLYVKKLEKQGKIIICNLPSGDLHPMIPRIVEAVHSVYKNAIQ